MDNIILIVDDEMLILNSIKRLLRKQSHYSVVTAQSGEEALIKLNTISPSVIISDMRMPEMDGLTFLSKAKEIAPDAIRMVLSAFADTELIIESINRGEIWRYLLKPWDDQELILAISNGVDLYEARKNELISQEKIRQLNGRLQSIISSVNDAVLVTDSEGRVIITNSVFDKIYPAEIKQHPLDDFITSIHSNCTISDAIAKGKCTGMIGKTFVDISIGKYEQSKHQSAYLVLVIRDMSREHEIDQLKSDFVSSVSHELRTPLSSIIGFSKMMRRNDALSNEQRHEYLDIIKQEAKRLSLLVENVLNMSAIEAGTRRYSMSTVRVDQIIASSVSSLIHDIEENDLYIDNTCTGDNTTFKGDKDALQQVFINLISNAIKFTPAHGSISVSLSEDIHGIYVNISDTGVGIAEDELPHIFDRFYRVKGESVKGTGIGLHLVHEIITAHHGKITVTSEVGKGSQFLISLPRGK